ncbi:MAG: efflux RND transporter periplasmic adaptor subunit [Bacteroidia bacterium]|nr:efflux RND transporter periplasmic adaptor subunit [Bacteroidia bacterium]
MQKINRALFILLLIYSFLGCGKKQEKIQPTVEPITESVYASGVIKSKNQYQVYSTVNGLLEEIIVQEGSLVKKGQPIIRLLNESSKLNTANAKLAAELADKNINGDKLNELKANMEYAAAKAKNDSSLYMRQKNLYAQQIGTLTELEQRQLTYDNSITNYKAAKLRYEDAKTTASYSARQARNNLEISTSVQGDFIIRSETDGRLYSILKEKGELVNSQSPVAVIGDANDFEMELQVDEYDVTRIKAGQKILLNMDSYKGEIFEGQVRSIETIMNERTRTFTVKADFSTKPDVLFPNLTVEANIVIHTKDKALTIPRNYLFDDQYVLNEKGEKLKVVVGLKDYNKAEIISGVSSSDYIYLPAK